MSHVIPPEPFDHVLAGLRLGDPVRVHAVTMFPLVGEDRPGPAYTTLAEALASGTVRISEVSAGGSVPDLLLRNDGDVAVFLLDGEELVGAKQNRVLNISVLAPARSTITVPVSCVEQGRWRYTTDGFSSSSRTLFARARKAKMMQVSESLSHELGRQSDQGEIWDQIQDKLARLQAHSASSAMSDAYQSQAPSIEEIIARLHPVTQQRGAVFAVGARVEGMELFDRHASLARLLASVVRGYALDALEADVAPRAVPTMDDVSRLLHEVGVARVQRYPAVGLGADLRFESGNAFGAALEADGRLIHLGAFAGKPVTGGSRRSRGRHFRDGLN